QAESQSLAAHYKAGRAMAVVGLGNCELARFAFRRALAKYLQARELAKPLNDPLLSGKIAGSIAAVYIQLNSAPQASAELSESISFLRRAGEAQAQQY